MLQILKFNKKYLSNRAESNYFFLQIKKWIIKKCRNSWTYVQSTARGRTFCHCPRNAPAPTGQDEVNWQTWLGRTPHGRAENQNTKSRLNKRHSLLRADFGKRTLQFPVLCCFYRAKAQLLGSDRFLISFLVKLWAQRQHQHCVALKKIPAELTTWNWIGFSCLEMGFVFLELDWLAV